MSSRIVSIAIVWPRIQALAGETFTQIRGGDFTYDSADGYIRLHRTNHSVPRTQIAKALERLPLERTTQLQDLRAPSYIFALLTDPRVRRDDY